MKQLQAGFWPYKKILRFFNLRNIKSMCIVFNLHPFPSFSQLNCIRSQPSQYAFTQFIFINEMTCLWSYKNGNCFIVHIKEVWVASRMDALTYKGTNVSKDVEIMRLVQGKKNSRDGKWILCPSCLLNQVAFTSYFFKS